MLNVRVVAPTDLCSSALAAVIDDPTVSDPVLIPGVALDGKGDLLLFDVARENANAIVRTLVGLGLDKRGSITITEPLTVLSRGAEEAERAAPGSPDDAVVWAQLEQRARSDVRPSWTFFAFLTLAALIASVGRYLDQPILIIGAMVVGPEFAPISAICFALARRRPRFIAPAAATLFGGFALAAVVTLMLWGVAALAGLVSYEKATTGPLTQFIVEPDVWSFIIALLAGVAGVLSLTTSKSSALVGVFISITTIPAVGTLALTLAVGAWAEALGSLIQLLVNVVALVISGTLTLLVLGLAWRRTAPAPSGR